MSPQILTLLHSEDRLFPGGDCAGCDLNTSIYVRIQVEFDGKHRKGETLRKGTAGNMGFAEGVVRSKAKGCGVCEGRRRDRNML